MKEYEFVLSEIKDFTDPHVAWQNTLDYCNREKPSDKWAKLPKPNIEKDVEDLLASLNDFHAKIKDLKIQQLFFDVDTLNKPYTSLRASTDLNYSYASSKDHSIRSLIRLINSYNKWKEPDTADSFTDYVLPLAYSGIIFVEALKRSHPFNMRIDWGFSEGDIFILYEDGKRVCKLE
ncbi:MAG: hypothetical protein RL095_1568 [Verrucomicrobiota bacterium]|jgi:hypothetical protein